MIDDTRSRIAIATEALECRGQGGRFAPGGFTNAAYAVASHTARIASAAETVLGRIAAIRKALYSKNPHYERAHIVHLPGDLAQLASELKGFGGETRQLGRQTLKKLKQVRRALRDLMRDLKSRRKN